MASSGNTWFKKHKARQRAVARFIALYGSLTPGKPKLVKRKPLPRASVASSPAWGKWKHLRAA